MGDIFALLGVEFEAQLAENNVYLEAAYGQLKDQEAILVQTEKLSGVQMKKPSQVPRLMGIRRLRSCLFPTVVVPRTENT